MTKFFKNLKQAKKATNVAPRSKDEINQNYGKLVAEAGQAQYQIFVYTEDLKRINHALMDVNREFAARQELDKSAAVAEEVKTGAV